MSRVFSYTEWEDLGKGCLLHHPSSGSVPKDHFLNLVFLLVCLDHILADFPLPPIYIFNKGIVLYGFWLYMGFQFNSDLNDPQDLSPSRFYNQAPVE